MMSVNSDLTSGRLLPAPQFVSNTTVLAPVASFPPGLANRTNFNALPVVEPTVSSV